MIDVGKKYMTEDGFLVKILKKEDIYFLGVLLEENLEPESILEYQEDGKVIDADDGFDLVSEAEVLDVQKEKYRLGSDVAVRWNLMNTVLSNSSKIKSPSGDVGVFEAEEFKHICNVMHDYVNNG
jgi:hypothetical protein